MRELSAATLESELLPMIRRRVKLSSDGSVDLRAPFTEVLPARVMLFPVGFRLPSDLFQRLLGAETAAYVFLPLGTKIPTLTGRWILSQEDVEAYERIALTPTDQLLAGSTGSWIVITTFEYALLGADDPDLVRDVAAAAPDLVRPDTVAEYVKRSAQADGFDVSQSWVSDLLTHIYGADVTSELLM